MLRNTFKAAWAHKRRLLSTTLAVLLGVAFMSGTLVLSDTLDRSIEEVFGDVFSETDAVVRGAEIVDTQFESQRAPIDQSLTDVIAGVEGVEAVAPFVEAPGRVLDSEGEPLGPAAGPPTFLQAWTDDEGLSGGQLAEGTTPQAPEEMVLNASAAEEAGYSIGDEVQVVTTGGLRTFTLVGTYSFGDEGSVLGAIIVGLPLPTMQEITDLEGQLDQISVRGADEVSQAELVERITNALPDGDQLDVVTGEAFAEETSNSLSDGLSFFTTLLLVFAFIALIVGAFIIFNTFSILVAQRSKELALLRALGASRRQVLTSVLIEAVVVGLVAAIIGLIAGVLLAIGLLELLRAIGLELPADQVTISTTAIVAALVTGMVVTLASALVPAWRATRVPPLAALRDVAHDESARSIVRTLLGMVLVAAAILFSLPALGADPDSSALQLVGAASFCLLLGLIVLGPVIARPLAKGFGAVLPLIKGTTGLLARENAARSPKRTASTAAALMIGVGLIVFINVFAASARASVDAEVTRGLQADYIAQPSGFELGIPQSFADEIRGLDDVEAASTVQGAIGRIEVPDGVAGDPYISAIDPDAYQQTFDVVMEQGELDDLRPGTMIYGTQLAESEGVEIGDEVEVTFGTAEQATFTVAAITDDTFLTGRIITQEDLEAYGTNITDQAVFILAADGAELEELRAGLDAIAEEYATVSVQDQDEFLGGVASTLNTLLNVVYGLLFLSILISLIGIANTLSLSVHERTRELGLLRAVGMSRAQVRSAVRWEAVIMSLIGTGLGLLLGLTTSYALVRGLRAEGLSQFELPVTPLIIITVVFAALGVVASLLPARRAAKLNILDAIAAE